MPISEAVVELDKIITQLSAARDILVGNDNGNGHVNGKDEKRRTMSASARKRISQAQKKRWAAYNKSK